MGMGFRKIVDAVKVRGEVPQSEDVLLSVDFGEGKSPVLLWGSGGAFRVYTSSHLYKASTPGYLLITDKESPASGDGVCLHTRVPICASLNYRLVVKWGMLSGGVDYVKWRLYYHDGSYLHEAQVRYVVSTTTWEYLDENNSWQAIATQGLRGIAVNILEFGVDFANDRYKYIVSNGTPYDLSGYSLHKLSNTTPYFLGAEVYVYSDGSDPAQGMVYWLYAMEE